MKSSLHNSSPNSPGYAHSLDRAHAPDYLDLNLHGLSRRCESTHHVLYWSIWREIVPFPPSEPEGHVMEPDREHTRHKEPSKFATLNNPFPVLEPAPLIREAHFHMQHQRPP